MLHERGGELDGLRAAELAYEADGLELGERAVAELVRRRDDRGARHGLVGPVAQRRRVPLLAVVVLGGRARLAEDDGRRQLELRARGQSGGEPGAEVWARVAASSHLGVVNDRARDRVDAGAHHEGAALVDVLEDVVLRAHRGEAAELGGRGVEDAELLLVLLERLVEERDDHRAVARRLERDVVLDRGHDLVVHLRGAARAEQRERRRPAERHSFRGGRRGTRAAR